MCGQVAIASLLGDYGEKTSDFSGQSWLTHQHVAMVYTADDNPRTRVTPERLHRGAHTTTLQGSGHMTPGHTVRSTYLVLVLTQPPKPLSFLKQ